VGQAGCAGDDGHRGRLAMDPARAVSQGQAAAGAAVPSAPMVALPAK
jgi:hypothetical protein